MDRLQEYINTHNSDFDQALPVGHRRRFRRKLEAQRIFSFRRTTISYWLAAASICAILLLPYHGNQYKQQQNATPEMLVVEGFYQGEIASLLNKIYNNNGNVTKYDKNNIRAELHEINTNYATVIREMEAAGKLQMALQMRIDCLRTQESFLSHILKLLPQTS
ncbi:MAG: hypothetical protein RIS47_447 [Bacteroidota bacterium]|jgi:hypothetical protein